MRIYTSTSEPLDFCDSCAPDETEALYLYSTWGDGPDGRGNCFAYDADHPDYNYEDIECEGCGLLLIDKSVSSWVAGIGTVVPDGYAQATN